jgi:hypothetical protein
MAATQGSGQYWFNVVTKQVEEGHRSGWQDLMGPYPTRAAAEHALEQAEARTKAWDAQDER